MHFIQCTVMMFYIYCIVAAVHYFNCYCLRWCVKQCKIYIYIYIYIYILPVSYSTVIAWSLDLCNVCVNVHVIIRVYYILHVLAVHAGNL